MPDCYNAANEKAVHLFFGKKKIGFHADAGTDRGFIGKAQDN